jgi:hypothetical protein
MAFDVAHESHESFPKLGARRLSVVIEGGYMNQASGIDLHDLVALVLPDDNGRMNGRTQVLDGLFDGVLREVF